MIILIVNLCLKANFTHHCVHRKALNSLCMYEDLREKFYKALERVDLINAIDCH